MQTRQNKKNFYKGANRPRGHLKRDEFIGEESMIKRGSSMRRQINLYWKKRAEEKKRRFNRAT